MGGVKKITGTGYCGFCKKEVYYEDEVGSRALGKGYGQNVNRIVFITSIEIIVEIRCPYCGEITQYKRAFSNF